MIILSSPPSSSPPSSLSFIGPRVPFSSLSSPSSFVAVSFKSSTRRRFACPCLSYSLKVPAMAEPINANDSSSSSSSALSTSGVSAIAMDSAGEKKETEHSCTFLNVSTEQELLLGIKKEMEAGRLPSNVALGLKELYHNYKNAVFESGNPKAEEIVLSNMAAAFDRILLDVEDPFVFSPYHKALREPFDYYTFGQNYIRPLVDFRNSYVGNISIFNEMKQNLLQGHNVVLISNHQSEADPAVIALLLETTYPVIAENMIYVAGDRVVTDPLCKPFSMGRNLICVYSKKHMNDAPELAEAKRKANTRSLKEMALLLRSGSKIVWIAPSGGRDRPDPVTEEWHPAPFDASAVDNMRRLVEHSGAPGHIYPLALLCYDIMPPPLKVEKEIGEKRIISFHGVGLSVAPEVKFSELAAFCEVPEEGKDAYTQALYKTVTEQYNILKSAIHGKQGLNAATPGVSLSQPWN